LSALANRPARAHNPINREVYSWRPGQAAAALPWSDGDYVYGRTQETFGWAGKTATSRGKVVATYPHQRAAPSGKLQAPDDHGCRPARCRHAGAVPQAEAARHLQVRFVPLERLEWYGQNQAREVGEALIAQIATQTAALKVPEYEAWHEEAVATNYGWGGHEHERLSEHFGADE
jgi:hypothetical protein